MIYSTQLLYSTANSGRTRGVGALTNEVRICYTTPMYVRWQLLELTVAFGRRWLLADAARSLLYW